MTPGKATMATVTRRQRSHVTVLYNVTYQEYTRLVEVPENHPLRMAYHDGVLEIVSPRLAKHEKPGRRLSIIVTTVADALGLPYEGADSATVRRAGDGPFGGMGKEPDRSFYFASVARQLGGAVAGLRCSRGPGSLALPGREQATPVFPPA